MQGQLEKGMDCDSAGIDGCDSRRSDHHYPLLRLFHHLLQKSGLSRTGLTCQKDTLSGLLHKLPRCLKLDISLHITILLYFLLI